MGEILIIIPLVASIFAIIYTFKVIGNIKDYHPDLPVYSIASVAMVFIGFFCIWTFSRIEQRGGMEGMGQGLILVLLLLMVAAFFGLVIFALSVKAMIEDRPVFYPISAVILVITTIGAVVKLTVK